MMSRKFFVFAALLVFVAPVIPAQSPTPAQKSATMASAAPMKIGGDVLPPVLISSVEPKFRRPLFHKPKPADVIVGLVVAIDGTPTNVHIIKSGGRDHDKSALNAVKQYRFRPATLHGKPVPVELRVEVNFRII